MAQVGAKPIAVSSKAADQKLTSSSDQHPIEDLNSMRHTVDTTSFLLANVSGESQRNTVAGPESVNDSLGRRWDGRKTPSVCHSLPSPDRNFKAVFHGVLSHFSPQKKSVKRGGDFHSESENREYLKNYLYCSKREKVTAGAKTYQIDSEYANYAPGSSSYFIAPGRISCTDPCAGGQCNIYSIDAVCGGLSFWFPTENSSSSSHRSSDILRVNDVVSPLTRTRSASLSVVEWENNEEQLRSQVDNTETWFGMMRREASKRFSLPFPFEHSELPFTPPGLKRRITLKRNHSR